MLSRRLLAVALIALTVLAPATACAGSSTADGSGRDQPARNTVVPAPDAGAADEATRRAEAMSVAERAAVVVMAHIPTADPRALRPYMASGGFGGFLLMGSNVPATEEGLRDVTAALTVDAALPPLIAIDEEGGDVARLPWDDLPSALTLKAAPASDAEAAFAARGALLSRAGVSVNFGIVADVTDDPGMFIYRRALGTDPQASADRVTAAVSGEAPYALSTLKHFPGHGAAPGDSHSVIPSTAMTLDRWRQSDGLPFAAGIDAGAPLLMFGHLAYTSVDRAPASLSSTWHRIARDDLGFEGVAITDDLGMLQATGLPEYRDPVANAVRALAAGSDMVLIVMFSDEGTASRIVQGIQAAVADGRISEERLTEAATRVLRLRLLVAASGESLRPCEGCAPIG